VGRLLAGLLVDTLDNLEDVEYSQLRAEFIATRLLYLVFPDEDSVPVGDTHEETISFLLQSYEALLQGATKKSVDEVLNDISEGNAVVISTIEGYVANIKSSILATTEYNTDGVFRTHRHFTFTDESGLGSTTKPIGYKWGDELHTHDIIDGIIQPHIDVDGNSHSHEVFLGIPENIIRLQNNLRKVFGITKPAHIKTGEVASIIDEDIPILAQGKGDVFSPVLGIDPAQTDGQIIEANKIDSTLPYYNQNAQYGLVGVSLGSFFQEDMRKAREGVFEPNNYGYVEGKTIRFWRTNIKVADTLVIGTQKLRVIEVSERIFPLDGFYEPIQDENNQDYTYRLVRNLRVGTTVRPRFKIYDSTVEVVNGNLRVPALINGYRSTKLGSTEILNDGEPIDLIGEIYFCDLMSDDGDSELIPITRAESGHIIRVSYIEVKVDAQISNTGLQVVKNASSTWQTRDQVVYETVEFLNNADPIFTQANPQYDTHSINLPAYIVKDMLKTINGLPTSIADLTIKIEGVDVDYTSYCLALEHTNILEDANITNPQDHVMRIHEFEDKPFVQTRSKITLTYPKAKSEIRRFRELNSIEMTLNATRPTRKVSLSGRGIGQNRVIETTSPISYVLNEAQPISPFTQEQKVATYSAGSSDLLNTSNQTLNTTYTLNNFSLNQTATQEQVFDPASSTVNTANPKISFYQLGFRPSYITSVIDSDGVSYTYQLNKDHVLIDGLTEEKAITVSGISSNPFDSNLDWYKGEKLAEGQAFFKHTSTVKEVNGEVNVDLGAFTESTPEQYMTNPLGLAPDQIRSIYSMEDTQTTGVEGELTFYEDVITGYDLDGTDGFTDEYNPHTPQDEWLYPDPSLYILGPINIPTHFFFGYSNLTPNGGDGFYFSLYRIDAQGNRQYQTLSLRADSNGFTALEQYPDPVPNGSPLAYRFRDDSLGSPNTIDYDNAPAPNFLAEINASFNHLANETYYLEVFMEEDNGADYLYFLTSGTDADFDLESSWTTSPHAYRLDQSTVGTVNNVSYTYEITFTLNPGEIKSFTAGVENPKTINLIENNAVEIGYSANDNYPIPRPAINLGWKSSFETTGFIFSSVDDRVPNISDFLDDLVMRFAPINEGSTVSIPTDGVATSLLLFPADITQSVGAITDDLTTHLNYVVVREDDVVKAISADLDYTYILKTVNLDPDNIGAVSDSIELFHKLVPSDTLPSISDSLLAQISSISPNESVPLISDDMLVSYAFLPVPSEVTRSTVPPISDDVSLNKAFEDININSIVLTPSDSLIAYIASINTTGVVSLFDNVSTQLRLNPINESDTIPDLTDSIIAPIYQTLVANDTVSVLDSVTTSTFIYRNVDDSLPTISDSVATNHIPFVPINPSDFITAITDDLSLLHAVAISMSDTVSFNDFATAYISSTNPADTVPQITVTDSVSTQFKLSNPYVYLSIRYRNASYAPYVHIYKGEMDSLDYLPLITYEDSDGFERWTNPQNSTFGSPFGPTNGYLRSTNDTNSTGRYTNSNDDAIARVGPLEMDTEYTLYFRATQIVANSIDENAAVAMKIGTANETTDGYLSGETYTELGPATQTFFYPTRYYYHKFTVRSQQYDIQFTQSTVMGSGWTGQTRVYFYIKYTANNAQEFYRWQIKEADYFETAENPASESNTDGTWIEPTLHNSDPTWPQSTYVNYSPSSTYNYTYGYYDDTNVNNVARLSYPLSRYKRYKLKVYAKDNTFPDMRVFIRAGTEDNGASFDTEFDSNSNLTYTELFQKDSSTTQTFRHFFLIRDDGFVVWEHDPNSRS
jgi:hypothetical protein